MAQLVGMNIGDDIILEHLGAYAIAGNFEAYKQVVDVCSLNVEDDFWREIFSGQGATDDEIKFWITYQRRPLEVDDIGLIPLRLEHLFDLGLARADIDLSNVDAVIEMMEEDQGNAERIEKIRNDPKLPAQYKW